MLNFSDADQERTLLTSEARKQVLAVLENPPEPAEALREAMNLHKAGMRDGTCTLRAAVPPAKLLI